MTTPTRDAELDGGDAPALLSKLGLEDPYPSDVSTRDSDTKAGEEDLTISVVEALQPLQNPLILKHLFERCPWRILMTIRQVCKLWRDLSLEAWLSTSSIRVRENHFEYYDDYAEDIIHEASLSVGPIPFEKFVDNAAQHCPKPFRNIQLKAFRFQHEYDGRGYNFNNQYVGRNEQVDQLWNLCGNGMHLTTLELYCCQFTDVAQFHKLIYKFCTNLQHLKLIDINLYGPGYMVDSWYPEPIGNLLTAFKHVVPDDGKQLNLKSLHLNFWAWKNEYRSSPDSLIAWPELISHFRSLTSLKLEIDGSGDLVAPLKGAIHLRRLSDRYRLLSLVDLKDSSDNKEPTLQMEVNSVTFGSTHGELANMWKLSGSGKYLTILELNYCKFPTVEEFRYIIFTSCTNLRHLKLTDCEFPPLPAEDRRIPCQYIEPDYGRQLNLKSLTVSHFYADEYQPHLPVTWLEILSHFPCLTSLEVELVGEGAAPFPQFEIIRILEAVKLTKEHDYGLQHLQSLLLRPHLLLSSPDIVSDKVIRFLHKLQLPLEGLVIKVNPEKKSGPAVLENALEFNCRTLTSLSIHSGKADGLPLPHWHFPWSRPCHVQLANLDSLEICQLLCPHLEFLKITPNLRKLSIYGIHNGQFIGGNSEIVSNTSKSAMANVKLNGLRSFTLDSVISLEDLTWLIKWMPRLVELTLPLDDEQIALVCLHWRNLEKLTVLGNGLTDEGLTGIKWGEEESVIPNMTYLQDLGRLTLCTQHLTDSSVINVFCQLPKLTSVWTFGKPMKLSHAARRCLKNKTIQWEQ